MRREHRVAAACAAVAGVSVLLAYANSSTGDYPSDAAPAIRAVLDGHIREALGSQPIMGSLSLLVRLPFAALASLTGGGELAVYRLGCIPCLFALGLAGLALAGAMARAGAGRGPCAVAAGACLLNPLTWEAIRLGHPEELLAAAFVLIAALRALEDRPLAAGVALGLALGTKQWAVIAALPVLAAAPRHKLRLGAIAAAIVVVLTLPLLLGDPNSFYGSTRQAGWAGERVYPFNAIWPLAPSEDRVIDVAGTTKVVTVRVIPTSLAHLLHPAIVFLALPLTAAALLVRKRLGPSDLFALLGLLFLLRCLLDPVDNAYYHVPFLLSLAAWEGLGRRRAPLLAVLASVAIYFAFYKAHMLHTIGLRNAGYLVVTLPFAVGLATALFRRRAPGRDTGNLRGGALAPVPLAGR